MAQGSLKISPAFVDSLQQQPEFEYANSAAYWPTDIARKKTDHEVSWWEKIMESGLPKLLVYLLVIVLVIIVVVRLLSDQNMALFTRKPKRYRKRSHDPESEHDPGIEEQIQQAESAMDFREAVRLQYLSLLFLMRDKMLVDYHPEWTNAAYLKMFKPHAGFATFKHLTRIYEFVYYGGFETDLARYQQISMEFSKFRKSL